MTSDRKQAEKAIREAVTEAMSNLTDEELRELVTEPYAALRSLLSETQEDDAMVERMARLLFAQTTEARSGFHWPLNGDWGRERDMERARTALRYVLTRVPVEEDNR